MWKCHKCGKPVYFAERKQSLGFDWHPECLRCEECGKRLNPGQHAEHKGVPYCHVPCYGALFGPQLFGHGTRVESHTSFGKVENKGSGDDIPRSLLETKLKSYNQYYEGKSGELKCRKVNGRLVLEGVVRVYWGVHQIIHLKEDDDQRTFVVRRKRNYSYTSHRRALSTGADVMVFDDNALDNQSDADDNEVGKCTNTANSNRKLDFEDIDWEELEKMLDAQSDGIHDGGYQTLPSALPKLNGTSETEIQPKDQTLETQDSSSPKNAAIRRCPGMKMSRVKLRRRCSINGHFYNRETSVFTPPYGSHMSVWGSSLVTTHEVITMLLEKYKVESTADNFALFVVRENGERRRLRNEESPLLTRVLLGPHEEVARIFLMDSHTTQEISPEVAQFINLRDAECNAILRKFREEEEREVQRIQHKYGEMHYRIRKRMEELKVRL